MSPSIQKIVIGSYLEEDLVRRIEQTVPSATVVYEPAMLPVPRYRCDHSAPRRELPREDLERWRGLVKDADVYFDFDWLDAPGMPMNSPRLMWIQATSAGMGSYLERTGLQQSDIIVTTAAGIHAVPLSEYALMGVLHFVKGVPLLSRWKAQHHWERYTTGQLAGRRALVIGLGGIGRRVAATFSELGVEVWGLGRDGVSYDIESVTRILRRSELDDALEGCDIVIVCCPLTPETNGLLGAPQLNRLPASAVIINISRGQVIDQDAMIAVLVDGRISGACMDVFVEEPLPADSPLWDLENVVISPHSASTVATENAALVDLFIDNIQRFETGSPLRNLYRRALGY